MYVHSNSCQMNVLAETTHQPKDAQHISQAEVQKLTFQVKVEQSKRTTDTYHCKDGALHVTSHRVISILSTAY
jgi:hypothetical protein